MSDLLAEEVKEALDTRNHAELLVYSPGTVISWLRALVERCEQEAFDLAHERDSVALLNHTIDALRQRHAQDVEAAFREGHAAGANDYFEASHGAGVINACKAWLASEARRKVGT